MQTQYRTGGGCNPIGINKPSREEIAKRVSARMAEDKRKSDEFLKTTEGIEWLRKEQIWREREANKMTNEQWLALFNEMVKRGFQKGDIAILDPEKDGMLPTIHHKSQRTCVYVQADSLVNLYEKPGWMINPFHWRGALVCLIEGYVEGTKITAVECIGRGPHSARVKIVERN